ncbi:succinyl-CoA:(S)-malate CoA-transferase subunit A [Burkholderiales bacterium]|nr:succinyl-CoA:(S)-malate CoA-transferase subunit A [Burkholderiales bacterium]
MSVARTVPGFGPLAGLKVIELGQLIAGPFAGKLLAEFGARVIKVEPPGQGDPLRQWRILHEGNSLWWEVQARNKESITVDLRQPEGQEIVRRLAREADVLIENFRPGTMEKWGLGWEALHAINPRLVMLRLSGFGQTGPYRDQPGFGAVGESMGGMRYVSGHPDRPPVRIGISIGDALAAMFGVIGALMALRHRDVAGGEGQMVDVALYEAVFAMMESLVPEYDLSGYVRERTGAALAGIVPSNTYTTRDGQNVVVAGNGDSIFKRLMQAIGRDDLAADPALASNAGRVARVQEIDAAIADWAAEKTVDEAVAILQAAEVPSGKIYSVADILRDPQYAAREMIRHITLRDGTPLKVPGLVPKLSSTPGDLHTLAPRLGEQTREVLAELDYSEQEIADLATRRVI